MIATGPDVHHLCDGIIEMYNIMYVVYDQNWVCGVSSEEGLILTESNCHRPGIDLDKKYNKLKIVGIDLV